jgi:hypothetical protein
MAEHSPFETPRTKALCPETLVSKCFIILNVSFFLVSFSLGCCTEQEFYEVTLASFFSLVHQIAPFLLSKDSDLNEY